MESKTLLFIANTDGQLASFAKRLFQLEADKMDVAWISSSRTVNENDSSTLVSEQDLRLIDLESMAQLNPSDILREEDLKSVDMVICLNTEKKTLPPYNGDLQIWKVSDGASIKENISSLMVRLIMQGGRRTPVEEKTSPDSSQPSKSSSNVRVQLEKKKRRGKKVTTISGLILDEGELQELAKKLKQACGTGGTVKDGVIEIQGNKCDQILEELRKLGYKAKRSGG